MDDLKREITVSVINKTNGMKIEGGGIGTLEEITDYCINSAKRQTGVNIGWERLNWCYGSIIGLLDKYNEENNQVKDK